MQKKFYSIYHTRAFLSVILEKLLFGWLTVLLMVLISSLIVGGVLLMNKIALGLILFGSIIYIYIVLYIYIFKYLRDPHKEPILVKNYAAYMSFDVAKLLSEYFPSKLTYSQLFEAAARSNRGTFVLYKMGLTPEGIIPKVRDYLEHLSQDLSVDNLLETFWTVAQELEEPVIDGHIMLWVFFEQGGIFQEILNQTDLATEDLTKILHWESLHHYNTQPMIAFSPARLRKEVGSVGRSWNLGYTNDLDQITGDLTTQVDYTEDHRVIIHQPIVKTVLHTLTRASRNNVLLLGGVGVGKSNIVANLAFYLKKYQLEHNHTLSRVLKLQVTDLLSGMEDAPGYLLGALKYAERSGNIIIVIESISELFITADESIRNIIVKFLNSGRVHVIGIDDPEGYHRGVKTFPVIDNLFEKIEVPDASWDDTMNVLMRQSFMLEHHDAIQITYQSLKAVMNLTTRYITKGGFPGKAVETLGDAIASARSEGASFVLEYHIRSVVSSRTNINLNLMQSNEKNTLMNLEANLKSEIKGQDQALESISDALKRAKLDVGAGDKPLGTFLFLGPTGVGKTETAKALAKHYFGSKERMIRLDMNEFGQAESVYGILGNPNAVETAYQEGFLTKQVQDRPFSLILLDEIEKAHRNVLNIFLQILDEGFLIDNRGVRTDFRNTIIIATSNAGAIFLRNFLREHQDFDKSEFKSQLLDEIINGGQFAPEFLNRFTEVIVYYPLTLEHVADIAHNMIESMAVKFNNERGIILEVESEAIQYIAEQGYSPDFGARELERTVTNILETYLADYMLLHNVTRGQTIHITKAQIEKD